MAGVCGCSFVFWLHTISNEQTDSRMLCSLLANACFCCVVSLCWPTCHSFTSINRRMPPSTLATLAVCCWTPRATSLASTQLSLTQQVGSCWMLGAGRSCCPWHVQLGVNSATQHAGIKASSLTRELPLHRSVCASLSACYPCKTLCSDPFSHFQQLLCCVTT